MRDLLPSSSMIKDLSQEFGIPISQEDLTDAKLLATLPQPDAKDEDIQRRTSNLPLEIQAHQEKYLQWRNNMLLKNQVQRDSLIQVGVLSSSMLGHPDSKGLGRDTGQITLASAFSSDLGHWAGQAVVWKARLNYARAFASGPTYLSCP